MSYTPNAMNANGVDERAFQALYTQHRAEIDAYLQAHHGGKDPREAAFQAVTGQPWPDGRGVNSSGQMTKDRTFKSVMGKYVAPIAAGALTAGLAIPAIAGAGGAAAAGAGGAGAAGAAGAGAAGAGAAGTLATVAGAATTGKSVWDRLQGVASNPLVGAAGDAISGATQASAHNRGVEMEANIARAQLDQQAERDVNSASIARSQDDRAGAKSAWEMLNHAAYVKNAPENANTLNLSPYSKPVAGPGADARAGAGAVVEQNRDDLMSGRFHTNGGAPLPMPQRVGTGLTLPEPGMAEQIGNYAGPALTAWDRLNRLRGQTAPSQTPRSTQAAGVDPYYA